MAALAYAKNINDKFSDSNTDEHQNNREQYIINQLHNGLSFIFFALLFFSSACVKRRK
jgi:hypothetical protein